MEKNIIYGRNPIKEAIRAHKCLEVYLMNGFQNKELLDLIKQNNVPVKYVSNKELDVLAEGGASQGIAALVKPFNYASLEEIISFAKNKDHPIILMLDGINDPHNLGAIIRSADVFDVAGIILPKHNSAPINATVNKTSTGALNFVKVAVVNNLNQAIEKLKDAGYWIVSADGSGNVNCFEMNFDFPTVLVIGSEGFGISSLVLKNSDYIVKIPMYGKVNSLNASVATGILLSQIKK